jgi:hypothetical protein
LTFTLSPYLESLEDDRHHHRHPSRYREPLAGSHVQQPTRHRVLVQGLGIFRASFTRPEPGTVYQHRQLLRAAAGQWCSADAIIAYTSEQPATEEAEQGLEAFQANG